MYFQMLISRSLYCYTFNCVLYSLLVLFALLASLCFRTCFCNNDYYFVFSRLIIELSFSRFFICRESALKERHWFSTVSLAVVWWLSWIVNCNVVCIKINVNIFWRVEWMEILNLDQFYSSCFYILSLEELLYTFFSRVLVKQKYLGLCANSCTFV